MKNVLTPLAKGVLVPLGLTAAASATDAAIKKKTFEFGITLIISNEENQLRFNGIYSRNSLPRIKDRAYIQMSTNQ